MKYVNSGVRKKDAEALVTGQPVYTDDLAPKDCLIVKILRSPHAHALIEEIKTDAAMKVPGIVCILTYKDVPQDRFTMAGQTYPEFSPYDRLILDQRVRFVGDAVAIVAGETEAAVDKALKIIKVKYQVLDAILDFHDAKDNKILIHPEDNWESRFPVGADNKRNLCASSEEGMGNLEETFAKCKYVVEKTYHTKANQQAMMETFRSYTYLEHFGRLVIVSSTQVPFHVRRILGRALGIGASKVRVIKPRIGGGFGAKQTLVTEVYPAIVTIKTGRPAKLVYTRYESQICSSPRHEMEVKVKVGADEDGKILAIDLFTLSNTGAFGEHGPTTVALSGHKSIGLYRNTEAYRFGYDVVYTNRMAAGAYRGYGATQGIFALESAVSELAEKMGMDPTLIREKNMIREGDPFIAYDGSPTATSCTLDQCMERAKEMIGWDEKYPYVKTGPHTVRSVGMAMAMQGSGIGGVDVGSVQLKLNDDGFYTLMIGCSDMGTGCDTILAQMTADGLGCEFDDIIVRGVDTDQSPYDSGSYASSTTYVTGMAVVKACESMRKRICEEAAAIMGLKENEVEFDGETISENDNPEHNMTLSDLITSLQAGNGHIIEVTESHTSPVSPPPFMAGAAEIEVDLETGKITPINYVAAVDCGTVINTNLARIQAEGGLVQGLGMTLYEDMQYTKAGKMKNRNFMSYKIPTRLDMGNIKVEFESSYEETGPFGAKSIGEIVINTPAPAIADAVYNATGLRFRTLPITAEQVLMGLLDKEEA